MEEQWEKFGKNDDTIQELPNVSRTHEYFKKDYHSAIARIFHDFQQQLKEQISLLQDADVTVSVDKSIAGTAVQNF